MIAAQYMPAGVIPAVPINDKKAYPVYAKCVELDIPIFVNGGVPGPPCHGQPVPRPRGRGVLVLPRPQVRVPPLLRTVGRSDDQADAEMAEPLLLDHCVRAGYYPQAIIDYANTRGADKVFYGGYYPYGLELERIFRELPELTLKDEVWPKFLRQNALRILKLDRS